MSTLSEAPKRVEETEEGSFATERHLPPREELVTAGTPATRKDVEQRMPLPSEEDSDVSSHDQRSRKKSC